MFARRKLAFLASAVVIAFGLSACVDKKKEEETVSATPGGDSAAIPPPPGPTSFAPETVYFAFDDFTLNSDAQTKLTNLATFMKESATAVVQIEGHCDERGSIEYNLALGDRRAQSAKNFLTQMGVDGNRVTTISYGEEKPVDSAQSEEAWAKNRRGEFNVTAN